ncbi:PmoA family protein, partial [Rubripirellula sp.]
VAKKISAVFGNGVLTGSSGRQGEQDLFGQPLEWVDYSGEVKDDCIEGITYFDHPSNSTFPSKWHVRDDGWMGASICRDKPVLLRQEVPVTWRYLLHAHSGKVDHRRAKSIADMFAQRAPLEIMNDPRPHYEATVRRVD